MSPDHIEQAASWQARLLSDRCSAQDRQGFSEWLRQDEAHHHAYDLVSRIWKSGSFDHAPRSPAVTRRRVLGAMAALGATLVTTSRSADAVTIRTGRGATRHVAFGAIQIDMDACSTLMHAPGSGASGIGPAAQGAIAFGEGRYALSITRAATRQTFHCGSWRAEGGVGRYAIDIAPQAMKIAVLAGGLRLTHPHYPALSLIENQVLVVDGRTGHIERQSVRMDDILAWREGRVVFRDTPLDRALSEMARYTDRPVTLLSPALGGLHISGVFHTRDPRRFFNALSQLMPVKVLYEPRRIAIVKL